MIKRKVKRKLLKRFKIDARREKKKPALFIEYNITEQEKKYIWMLEEAFNFKAHINNISYRIETTYLVERKITKIPIEEVEFDDWETFECFQELPQASMEEVYNELESFLDYLEAKYK